MKRSQLYFSFFSCPCQFPLSLLTYSLLQEARKFLKQHPLNNIIILTGRGMSSEVY